MENTNQPRADYPQSLKSKKELQIYFDNSSPGFKEDLKNIFGKEMFEQKIADRPKTVEQGILFCLINYGVGYSPLHEENTKPGAFERLLIIAHALNEGEVNPGKQVLYSVNYSFQDQYLYPGKSELCIFSGILFKTKELAEHAINYFPDLFKTLLT